MRRLLFLGFLAFLLIWAFSPLMAQTREGALLGAQAQETVQGENLDPQEIYRRAKLLMDKGNLRHGLDLFLQLREQSPRYRPLAVQRHICQLYERLGNISKALEEYGDFIKRFPWARDRVQMLMRMAAMAEVALHDLNRAWGYLEMIPEDKVPPGDMAPYLFNKGYLLEKMDRKDEALEYYRRLVEEYPQTVGGFWAKERIKKLEGQESGAPKIILPREGKP